MHVALVLYSEREYIGVGRCPWAEPMTEPKQTD